MADLDPSLSAEERFLAGEPIDPGSSYAREYSWLKDTQTLLVRHDDGQTWSYTPVTEEMARDLYQTPSKGSWCWDHLRVRGSLTEHQPRIQATRLC
jgi:hypothetical protein